MSQQELTVPEAAEYLGVTAKDVRGYIARGELAAWNKTINPTTCRPRYRIPRKTLDAFKESRMVRQLPKHPPTRRSLQMPRMRL
jgi:excisionase family DNA binding protein